MGKFYFFNSPLLTTNIVLNPKRGNKSKTKKNYTAATKCATTPIYSIIAALR